MKKITLLVWLVSATQFGFAQQSPAQQSTDSTSTISTTTVSTVKVQPSPPAAESSTVKLGLRLAPAITFNSAQDEEIGRNITNNGADVRLSGGLIADFFLSETYAFSTGLWYTIKRSSFKDVPFPPSQTSTTLVGKSEYNLQYLQIPISLKLFTNEISTDTRIYFQVGGTCDVKLAERALDKNANALYLRSQAQGTKAYKPVDVSLLLGMGVEFRLSEHNYLFGGLTYNRGVINAIRGSLKDDFNDDFTNKLKTVNSLLALEVGIKF
ncbi:MAG: porin family protein [Bacteroidota bacterium]